MSIIINLQVRLSHKYL